MTVDVEDAKAVRARAQQNARNTTKLETKFFVTRDFETIRSRIFGALAEREEKMRAGLVEHQEGAALIGAPGSGKSRMIERAIAEHHALSADCEETQFGYRVLSVLVPGDASITETCEVILKDLGYPTEKKRDVAYLMSRVRYLLKEEKIAGLWLDEVQDVGRHATEKSIKAFTKRFRNLMQDSEWPVCLFLSATLEGRKILQLDKTLSRRLNPIEILPLTFTKDAALIRSTAKDILVSAGVADTGLFDEDEFMKMLIHASGARFGVCVTLIIRATIRSKELGRAELSLDDFAFAYFKKTHCQDELNPFMSQHWASIDTNKILDLLSEEEKQNRRLEASKRRGKK